MASVEVGKGIESYFTNVQKLRSLFEKAAASPELINRILMIHGMAGVGKRSLLLMFAHHCKSQSIPYSMVSAGPEINSSVDILTQWAKDLTTQHYSVSTFNKTLRQTKEGYITTSERSRMLVGIIGKLASKTAEGLVGSVVGTTVGAAAGALGSAAIGTLTEETMAFVTAPLEKSEKELLRNPESVLTELFLADIEKIAKKRRIVLMIDSYEAINKINSDEKPNTLDQWICKFAKNLPQNVLLVIAGQSLVDWRQKSWQELRRETQVEKLDLMEPKYMKELTYRYFAVRRETPPTSQQVQVISEFSGGLPVAIIIALEILKFKSAKEFQEIKPLVLMDLVTYLLESIPEKMAPILEAASILRWFDEKTLRESLANSLTSAQFRTLSNYDFLYYVSGEKGILMVGDSIRKIICEYLQLNFPDKFKALHEKAISYYENRLDQTENNSRSQKEYEKSALELLYHLIQIDREAEAISKSREFIDRSLGTYGRLFGESVIRLLDNYLQDKDLRRWIIFFRWFVTKLSADVGYQASTARELLQLLSAEDLDVRLRAAIVTMLADHPAGTDLTVDQRITYLEDLIKNYQLTDEEKARAYLYLGGVYRERIDWNTSINDYTIALGSCQRSDDVFGVIRSFDSLAYTYLLTGDWNQAYDFASRGVALSRDVGGYWLTTALKTKGWVCTYKGDLAEGLTYISEALELVKKRNDETEIIKLTRRLADIYDRQNRWSESNSLYLEFIEKDRGNVRVASMSTYLALLGTSYLKQGRNAEAETKLTESLVHIDKHNEPLALIGLGQVCLNQMKIDNAKQYFEKTLVISQGRPYYITQATFGLVQAEYLHGNYKKATEHAQKVQSLSDEHMYHDILAKLKLFQSNAIVEKRNVDQEYDSDVLFSTLQDVLLNALRYNSFLLDEVLLVGVRSTQIKSIINLCLDYGAEGRQILEKLRHWWLSGNDPKRSKTILLLQSEKLIRDRDLGKNKRHVGVVDQIEKTI